MFCENCGTKNADGAAFCENCGAKLTSEAPAEQAISDMQGGAPFTVSSATYAQPAVQVQNVPRKPMSKKTKALIIVAIVLAVALFGGFQLLKSMASPQKVAKGYFESFINGNYEQAYSYLDVTESEFITAENFARAMKEQYGEGEEKVLNYSVTEAKLNGYVPTEGDKNLLKKVYNVNYTKQGDSDTYPMSITLLKQNKKKFLFFDDYKVAVSDYIANSCEFRVPSGTTLYINGVLVSDKYKYENEDEYSYYDCYLIPSMFEGNYDIKVTGSYMKDKELTVYVDDYDNYNYVNYVELNDETVASLEAMAEEYIKAYVTAAMAGKEFTSLSDYFGEDANVYSIEKNYNNMASKSFDSEKGTGVKDVVLGAFEFSENVEYSLGSYYCVECDYQYDYKSYYKYWSDDEPEEYSPEEYETETTDVYFVFENGEWKVSDGYPSLYFYY